MLFCRIEARVLPTPITLSLVLHTTVTQAFRFVLTALTLWGTFLVRRQGCLVVILLFARGVMVHVELVAQIHLTLGEVFAFQPPLRKVIVQVILHFSEVISLLQQLTDQVDGSLFS